MIAPIQLITGKTWRPWAPSQWIMRAEGNGGVNHVYQPEIREDPGRRRDAGCRGRVREKRRRSMRRRHCSELPVPGIPAVRVRWRSGPEVSSTQSAAPTNAMMPSRREASQQFRRRRPRRSHSGWRGREWRRDQPGFSHAPLGTVPSTRYSSGLWRQGKVHPSSGRARISRMVQLPGVPTVSASRSSSSSVESTRPRSIRDDHNPSRDG